MTKKQTIETIVPEQCNNIIRFPGEPIADIEAVAAGWLARMTSGSATLADISEFEFWRSASPDHARIYGELEDMWEGLRVGTAPRSRYRSVLDRLNRTGPLSGWSVLMGQIAAGLVAVVMASQYMSTWRYEYHTAPGEVRSVTLTDGSVVRMKGGTALDADVSESGARTVHLARGEAFFEVVHDAARPFTVTAGRGTVHDIGTAFSVERAGRSAKVAVEHGVVAVVAGGRSDTLTPGEQVSFNDYRMSRKSYVDTTLISAWRRGLYVSEGKPLGEVLADIDEYYSGRIIVTSRALAARRVNAVVQFGHVDAWLDALNETKGVSVHRWGPLVIVGDRTV